MQTETISTPLRKVRGWEIEELTFHMETLTKREMETCELLLRGLTNKKAAAHLKISARTVETYRKSILKKLKVANLVELAYRLGAMQATMDSDFVPGDLGAEAMPRRDMA